MARAYFNILEAEALLPALSYLVKEAQTLKRKLDRAEAVTVRQQLVAGGEMEAMIDLDDLKSDGGAYADVEDSFYRVVEKITAKGGVLRDVDQGAVDFYTRFEGKDALLSWQVGERRIRYWREPDEPFVQRKRIIDLK